MKKTKKKFYLTKLAKPGFWHYVGDPLHPNTTMDTGIIAVYNEDIRVDEFGSYVEYKIDKTMNTQQEEKEGMKTTKWYYSQWYYGFISGFAICTLIHYFFNLIK